MGKSFSGHTFSFLLDIHLGAEFCMIGEVYVYMKQSNSFLKHLYQLNLQSMPSPKIRTGQADLNNKTDNTNFKMHQDQVVNPTDFQYHQQAQLLSESVAPAAALWPLPSILSNNQALNHPDQTRHAKSHSLGYQLAVRREVAKQMHLHLCVNECQSSCI